MNDITIYFENKKVLILGYGREGKSTHNFILKNNVSCETFIYDQRDIRNELINEDVEVVDYDYIVNNVEKFDIIMKTPGISLMNIDMNKCMDKINTQTSIFINKYRNQIVGITGTKGKSTTSSLIYETLSKKYNNCVFCGNIGKPFFDLLDNIDEQTKIVCELSSHQLENLNVSPRIAVITNIYPEHLDHYESYDKYVQAKLNIIKYQKEDDICILNSDINDIISNIGDVKSKIYYVSMLKNEMFHMKHDKIYYNIEVIFDEKDKRNIIGEHNLFDIMILFNIAKIYNIENSFVKEIIKEFKGLPHRLEYVGTYNDIKFYNDSISTIPETCIFALENLEDVQTLIVGGLDRKVLYHKLIEYLNNHLDIKVICMHDTGNIIYNEVKNQKYIINDIKEAVKTVYNITDPGKTCLFSPAAASYGFYKNFEDRGNQFKECVQNYK